MTIREPKKHPCSHPCVNMAGCCILCGLLPGLTERQKQIIESIPVRKEDVRKGPR